MARVGGRAKQRVLGLLFYFKKLYFEVFFEIVIFFAIFTAPSVVRFCGGQLLRRSSISLEAFLTSQAHAGVAASEVNPLLEYRALEVAPRVLGPRGAAPSSRRQSRRSSISLQAFPTFQAHAGGCAAPGCCRGGCWDCPGWLLDWSLLWSGLVWSGLAVQLLRNHQT